MALPEMPDRTITFLSLSAGLIFVTYIVLVIVTITFATVQTSLALSVRETEGSISKLESTYYSEVAKESATSPAAAGLTVPVVVEYAIAKKPQGLSFAGK
jgi:hypothetical protein